MEINKLGEIDSQKKTKRRAKQSGLFILFLACGILVQPFPIIYLEGIWKILYYILCPILFLSVSLFLWKKPEMTLYRRIFFALFIYSLVNALQSPTAGGGLGATIQAKVVNLLISALIMIIPALILKKISGEKMESLYIKKGNLKRSLIIGGILFFVFLIIAVPGAIYLFGADPEKITSENLLKWAPWIGIFVVFNALREEIIFRGLFLKKYEDLFGVNIANLLQALIFTLAHFGGGWSIGNLILLIIIFFLGLGFGALMQKTDNIWGSILFHAGSDIPVMIMTFSLL